MRKKKETQKNRKERAAKLAATLIGAALGLLFYCGSFYVKAYMQNQEARQSYEELRKDCLKGGFAEAGGVDGADLGMEEDADGTDNGTEDGVGGADKSAEGCAGKADSSEEDEMGGADSSKEDRTNGADSNTENEAAGDDLEESKKKRACADESGTGEYPTRTAPAFSESFGISWESLYKVNHDVIAWIFVPGADISYPVVQGEDDEFYLHHSITKEEDPFGTIFLGSGNHPDFRDSHSFLYGHNMEGNMMFANLNRYEDRNFWKECPEFIIFTSEEMYRYRIFSIEQAGEQSPGFQYGYKLGSKAYKTQLNMLEANSMYETKIAPDCNEPMVTLVTCNSRLDEHVRMTIHGIRCETTKWEETSDEK